MNSLSDQIANNTIKDNKSAKVISCKKLLLIGNPNCGKTSLFNLLTGNKHKVANYPGVTVEKKEGKLIDSDVKVLDLPGIYSISGQSQDERVAESELKKAKKEDSIIITVLDATNLERNLYLVSELMDLGLRLIIVLNMLDIAKKDGLSIKEMVLQRELGVPVISVSAKDKNTINPLKELISSCLTCIEFDKCKPNSWVKDKAGLSSQVSLKDKGKVAELRYNWIESLLKKSVSRNENYRRPKTEIIDKFVLHPVLGFIFFILAMTVLFQAVFSFATYPMDLIDSAISSIGNYASLALPNGIIKSLIVDGVIAGVGSVVIFVPQIAILFFLIGILEQSGYLSRAAVVMDAFMRRVGLQGRSFIPLLSSFACAIPGIMATRSIPSYSERLLTILVAPLMSCSARLPVYTILISVCVPDSTVLYFSLRGLVLLGLYLLGVFGAFFCAWIFKLFVFKNKPGIFLMELPRYKSPNFFTILLDVKDRVLVFLKDAGTIILACSIVLWFLATFPAQKVEEFGIRESYVGQIGRQIEPVIKPLGFNWEIGIALLGSFAAREVFVSTLGTVYNLNDDSEDFKSLTSHLKEKVDKSDGGSGFSTATAFSLLVFYVFACQCMSTLAVCYRETSSYVWPAFMFIYMTLLAYFGAFFTFSLLS